MFTKVLIANRGEIACRIIRTLTRMGIESVAVYSEADTHARHVAAATQAVCIGGPPAVASYLNGPAIIEAALATGAEAVHPGYGFLSENADFAGLCGEAGIVFIGPTPEQMRRFGLKHTARELAEKCGVPLLPGTPLLESPAEAEVAAGRIGYPVILKSTAGGGGIGMRLCGKPGELAEGFAAVQRLGKSNFKHAGLYLEKYVQNARHIEVQIFGDGKGDVIALGERDCSAQRRHQKVIEETPAPHVDAVLRGKLFEAAVKLGREVKYQSAGTVEFVVDADSGDFYFLEVNTRLQVEHTVTEEVTGMDLVACMVEQAAGELPPLNLLGVKPQGAAIQVRVYAEDPAKNFQPCSGLVQHAEFGDLARVDSWIEAGSEVTAFYDPLLAKIIGKGADRAGALENLLSALAETEIAGIETNLDYLRQVLASKTFGEGRVTTRFLNTFKYSPRTVDVLKPGTQTTVQDWPGRRGYWAIGVPPSGPMDGLAFRLGNAIVGNESHTAGLELTATGPTLRFNVSAVIALTGAPMEATIGGRAVAYWRAVEVKEGDVLEMKGLLGAGARAYLAVGGGVDVPEYLGSRATFTLGKFGGHAGRPLRAGDVLKLKGGQTNSVREIGAGVIPSYANGWQMGVLYGPHGAPDFFTQRDMEVFFETDWKVHYNSDRTGVRLIGPHPMWRRTDGGEAGLHPSNIHDNAYAVGTIDFTGNMPVILGPDGPSLGGFVCPVTIVEAELWKIGQVRPGDTIRFVRVALEEAGRLRAGQDERIETLCGERAEVKVLAAPGGGDTPVIKRIAGSGKNVDVVYRQDGDRCLLVEYGPLVLDLNLRFRVHALVERLERQWLRGVVDLTPGIRSLHVHFDTRVVSQERVLEALVAAEASLPEIDQIEVATRIIGLPLSWDDPATQLAINKYTQSVRKDAPWCPSNIEFIRRINGLESIEQVKEIVFGASYLVLGLGDVYLGAPVATPVDPRHRLVTTKYNPARTWTPENAVGIGGAYLCVYGMEGPGGYQFVGRTCQMWNTYRQTEDFGEGKPWLLRFFDQIRFYPVSASELLKFREAFVQGKVKLDVTHETFRLREYNDFLLAHQESIAAFKSRQQGAFDKERRRWEAAGPMVLATDPEGGAGDEVPAVVPAGYVAVFAEVPGNMWKVDAVKGQKVAAGDRLAIIESMKMEIPVHATAAGVVADVFCAEGRVVAGGQVIFSIKP